MRPLHAHARYPSCHACRSDRRHAQSCCTCTVLLAAAVATIFTFMSGFSNNYWVYLASRLLTGVGAAGQALIT